MEQKTQEEEPPEKLAQPDFIILFDGVCNLCNGFINFIIDRDPEGVFQFGSLQSQKAKDLLNRTSGPESNPDALDSIILVEQGKAFTHSTAVLRILSYLGLPWKLLYSLIVVPRPVRDWVYDRVASNRYDWFGRRMRCRVPTPELKERFIE